MRCFLIKLISVINFISLMYWLCAIESICSWQPWVIMGCNALWLGLLALANGWLYDTKRYHEMSDNKYGE